MFKKIRLIKELIHAEEPVCFLPDGLYKKDNIYINNSNLIVKELKKQYQYGTWLKIKNKGEQRKLKIEELFQEEIKYQSHAFNVQSPRELTLNQLLSDINQLKYDIKKDPYENFLEAVLIRLLIDSLNIGKALLGSIWQSGGLSSKEKKFGKSNFTYFTSHIQDKNIIIQKLRLKLSKYPENFVYISSDFKVGKFNKNHSQHAVFLEYRILQVRFKTILQWICLQAQFFTPKDKQIFDDKFNTIQDLLHSYPEE